MITQSKPLLVLKNVDIQPFWSQTGVDLDHFWSELGHTIGGFVHLSRNRVSVDFCGFRFEKQKGKFYRLGLKYGHAYGFHVDGKKGKIVLKLLPPRPNPVDGMLVHCPSQGA